MRGRRIEEIQEAQYSIPYHYLPWERNGVWRVGRFLWWGYEYLAVLRAVLSYVEESISGILDEAKILDFGCGDGRLITELLARHRDLKCIVGVDISERALTYAKAATFGSSQVYFFPDIWTAVARLGRFHVIVAMEVLEHIPPGHLPQVVAEIHNALLPNGWFIVSVPTENIPVNRKHYQHFSVQKLSSVLADGFVLNDVRYIHRIGVIERIIRRMVVNRFVVANNEGWLKLCTKLYNRFVRIANERTGAHLVCRFRKTG